MVVRLTQEYLQELNSREIACNPLLMMTIGIIRKKEVYIRGKVLQQGLRLPLEKCIFKKERGFMKTKAWLMV